MALQLSERYWATKARLLRMLADLEASGSCLRTSYLRPDSISSRHARLPTQPEHSSDAAVSGVLQEVRTSETGLVIFVENLRVVAVAPPFPVSEDVESSGTDTSGLRALLDAELVIGIVLLRLGRYAVGVLRGDALVASKVGSRYVKRPHRAGGSSQRRFERSRERLVRELFDKTCEIAGEVFSPFDGGIDHILMGGERHTLRRFVERCPSLRALEAKTFGRVLDVHRPDKKAMDGIASEVWKSRVAVFDVV